jgi:hypothetical protein
VPKELTNDINSNSMWLYKSKTKTMISPQAKEHREIAKSNRPPAIIKIYIETKQNQQIPYPV